MHVQINSIQSSIDRLGLDISHSFVLHAQRDGFNETRVYSELRKIGESCDEFGFRSRAGIIVCLSSRSRLGGVQSLGETPQGHRLGACGLAKARCVLLESLEAKASGRRKSRYLTTGDGMAEPRMPQQRSLEHY